MKLFDLIVYIILFLILIIVVFLTLWKLDEARCYNMPLNKVYEDSFCQLHTQTYKELNDK